MSKGFTPPKNSNKITINISALEAEKRELTVNKTDPERLEKVKSILDHFNFGIIKTNEK